MKMTRFTETQILKILKEFLSGFVNKGTVFIYDNLFLFFII